MSVKSDTVSNRSRDTFYESGYQEVKSSRRRAWVVAGSVTFVVLCTIMAVTFPPALKDEKTTSATSLSTGTPTEAPDTFTTMSMSPSTSSTKSSISTTTFSPEILATTATLLRTTEEKTSSQSTTEISTSTTLVTPVLSTTTSYETTTVSVVEKVDECEYMNELLEIDICRLDVGYPLNHCNKNDEGCYKLQGKCVLPIYMDWTLCVDYFKWDKCEDDETEEPELIVSWCQENN